MDSSIENSNPALDPHLDLEIVINENSFLENTDSASLNDFKDASLKWEAKFMNVNTNSIHQGNRLQQISISESFLDFTDENNQTNLHWAVNNHDFNMVFHLLKKMPKERILLANKDNHYTALHIAVQRKMTNAVLLLLLKAGSELAEKTDIYGQLALHWAISYRDEASAFALLDHTPLSKLVMQNITNGYTPLHMAAQVGEYPIVNALLNRGGKELAHITDYQGQTALHWAAAKGDFMSSVLLINQMSVDAILLKNVNGLTALDLAKNKYPDIALLLTHE